MTDHRFHSLFDGCLEIDPTLAAAEFLKSLPSGKGLLLFTDSLDRPIQLLSSASMRAAASARLAPQTHNVPTKKADLSAVIARIYYLSTYCDFRSAIRYRQIAMDLYPAEYRTMMNLGRLSIVRLDNNDQWPVFSVVQRPGCSPGSHSFAPFPSHRAALAFAQALNHAFLLCREPSLAADTEKARSCPYLQMNTCPAPCIGRTGRDEYLARVESALQVACGHRHEAIEVLTGRMMSLAAERKFEDANQVKLSIQSLQPLTEPAYKWTVDLASLAVLHIDRSRKVKVEGSKKLEQSYAAFLIRPGRVDELPDFALTELAATLTSVSERLAEPVIPSEPLLTYSILLLENFLYRSTPPGILLDADALPAAEEVAGTLAARFAKASDVS